MKFIITLIVCLLLYIATVLLMKKFTDTKRTNLILILIIFLCHVGLAVKTYFLYGPENSNFIDCLPTSNVSPLMFLSTVLYFVFPKKIKNII